MLDIFDKREKVPLLYYSSLRIVPEINDSYKGYEFSGSKYSADSHYHRRFLLSMKMSRIICGFLSKFMSSLMTFG